MISRNTIDQIFQAARVEEVIGDFVNLKKSGSNYKGLSPFSQEKTPSFMVSPAKQIWKDFSSGKGGSVVSFLMEHEQFTYPEALRWLAKRYSIEIEEDRERSDEQIAEARERENQFTLTEFANKWFQQQLWETEEGKSIGYSYFKERGFTKATMQTFQLGYSPKTWDAFTQYALEKGYTFEALQNVGLSVGNLEKPVDRFRERVIFPIHSFSGRTLGFGARILGDNKKTAKYLNSPENEIYHKSKILYGVFQAKQAILKQDECFLVEGYTDVISLHQSGIENVVASSGTALTPEQIRLVKRLTNNLTLVYDGDVAGIKASFRGIDLILEQELNVRVVILPQGEDPDSFARKHKEEEIQHYFKEQAVDFIRFKVSILQGEAGDDPARNSEMIHSVIDSIALIPNLIQRELYVREASSILNISEELLFRQLAVKLIEREKETRKQEQRQTASPLYIAPRTEEKVQVNPFAIIEEDMIQLMIRYGDTEIEMPMPDASNDFYKSTVIEEIITQLQEDEIHFSTPHYREMFIEIQKSFENELDTGEYLLRHANEDMSRLASGLIFEKYRLSNWKKQGIVVPDTKSNLGKRVQEMVLNYKRNVLLQMISIEQAKVNKNVNSDADNTKILQEIIRLTQIKKSLDNILNRAI
ncbi:MAG: DNA primase [Flavobacteriaceae bacterium]|nr:DNA primase [Flavobacteriaceae bacterium]